MKKYNVFTLIILLFIMGNTFSCKNEVQKIVIDTSSYTFQLPEWAKDDVIYEVNLRQFTEEGTINAFSDHIPRLKEMGVDILWFMPVFPISETKRKGGLGSYYAVNSFRDINPEFGTLEDFSNLIQKAHAYGFKVVMDWVPNHTGWDHEWITSNPDFYTHNDEGKIIDPSDPVTGKSYGWEDVADLNYDNKEMREAMMVDLLYWVEVHKIDGYRMDVAWGVPEDFWTDCTNALLDANPDLFLLAEAEQSTLLNKNAFHAQYGWTLHHLMNDIAKGEKSAEDIVKWRDSTFTNLKQGNFMHFTSNHDENSWQGTVFERMPESHQTFAALVHIFDGIPLIYGGQEEPLKHRLAFFEKDEIGFSKFAYEGFYKILCDLKEDNPALWNLPYGGQVEIIGLNENAIAIKRQKDDNVVYAIFNLSSSAGHIVLDESISDAKSVFKDGKTNIEQGESTYLEAWSFMVAVK